VHFRKRNQSQIHGIEHQLHTHKNDNGIFSIKHPKNTERKKHRAQSQIMVDGDVV
jgi:hypothetical protein